MAIWGWWSTPSQQQAGEPQAPDQTAVPRPPQPPVPDSRPPQQQKPPASISQKARADALDRDEAALEELRAIFRNATDPSPSSTQPSNPPPSSLADTPPATTAAQADDPTDPTDSLYPSHLSCSQCFDAAYYCSSIGGQLTNVYRYGGLRSCSDLWAQWRFCMRTKTMSEEERRRRIREWNREKEARRRVGRNSEEVWALRKGGVGIEGAVPGLFSAAAAAEAAAAAAPATEGRDEVGDGEQMDEGANGRQLDGAVGEKVGWGFGWSWR